MDQLYDAIEMCFDIRNTNDECDFLTTFISCIMCDNDEEELDLMESKDKLFFKEVLHDSMSLRCNFEKVWQCSKGSEVKWKVAEELDWFVFYLFLRRFGWPDLEEENGLLKVALPDSVIKYRKSSKIEELKHKNQLVDLLDSVLLWLSHQPVSAMAVLMYSSAIRLASKAPVTRLHLTIRGSDWLKDNLTKDINDKLWHALQDFLILGATDMWSRIRDASITRLGPIVEFLQLPQILSLLEELILLCDSNQNQWQINDGAISAIGAILKRFQKVGYRSNSLQNSLQSKVSSPRIQCHIRIGDVELDRMPPLIMSKLKILVLNLIYNPQQTIRDNAIKAFVLCLDRYADHEIDAAFQDVYQRLSNKTNGTCVIGNISINSKTSCTRSPTFMDPYGAQSLICLCQHLFKRVQDKISYLENWYHYHCSFDQYLCHPASSVRLVTSNLYKYAISQSISHPLLVKNILHFLVIKWSPDQSVLLQNINGLSKLIDSQSHKRLSISKREQNKNESLFWEWREGRLLVYELFAKLIIKNHLWYTFGTTEVDSLYSSDNPPSRPTGSANIDVSPNESNLNLCDSDYAMNPERQTPATEDFKLSSSLNSRRMTFAGIFMPSLPFKQNARSISLISVPVSNNEKYEVKRRKSHDAVVQKRSHDSFAVKPGPTSKVTTSTSTQNIKVINHSSFLVQVKEMEDQADELHNPKVSALNDTERKLPTFRSLLSQMLHTSAESLIDSQWELRRMAKQTLPPLGEVLRWFDPGLLINIISTHLKFEPTLMTYVSLVLLHDALLHTSRLKQLLVKPPSSWQPFVASKIVHNIVTSVETNLPEWIKSCNHYLDRSGVFDCITPVSMNIAITSACNYGHSVPASNLAKSVVDTFFRLDKNMKSNAANIATVSSFDLYPSPSCASSDSVSLDYTVLLLDCVKENLMQWWQKMSSPGVMEDFYDQSKETILTCSRLMSLFGSWLLPVSEMRGDCSRYLKDLLKLLQTLSRMLFAVMTFDCGTKLVFLEEFSKLIEVYSKYIICKEIKLTSWWMRQLLDLIFIWLEKFQPVEIEQYFKGDCDSSPLLINFLQALLHRLHSSSSHRRATICNINLDRKFSSNLRQKRLSIDGSHHKESTTSNNQSFMKSEDNTNIELYSSQAVSDNVEYVSDESMNDSDEDKTASTYRESHVLNTPRHSNTHSITTSIDFSTGRRLNFAAKKPTSLQIPLYTDRRNLKEEVTRSSTESEDEADGSDWDSSSASGKSEDKKSPIKAVVVTDDAALVSEMIYRLMKYSPALLEQCEPALSEIDVTILKGLRL